jgi:formylglycine-generating enzyme required for sulfatase activity
MKKSVKLLLAALAFSILFAGCGSDGSDGKTPTVVKDADGKCYLGYTDGTFMMANGEKIQQECPGSMSFNKTSAMFDTYNLTIPFAYETTGDVTHLEVRNLPMDWKAEVDVVNKQVNITSPTTWTHNDQEHEVYVLALNNADEVKVAQMIKFEKPTLKYASKGVGTFNFIPRGTFTMGGAGANAQPTHPVTLTKGFYMATTETTQKQWQDIYGSLPSNITNATGKGDNYPVIFVYWNDMQTFVNRLNSQQPNITINGKKYKYTIPTEAQWEYAARAGTRTTFSWGNSGDAATASKYAWYRDNAGDKPREVAKLLPNPWGLYDTSGNINEIIQDLFAPYTNAPATDPLNDTVGTEYVIRGGHFNVYPTYLSTNHRYGSANGGVNQGFRLALVEE